MSEKNTTTVTFAISCTTADDKKHKAGTTANVPAAEARELILKGHARAADDEKPKPADASETDGRQGGRANKEEKGR